MKILLATDGSECSEGAARFLTRFRFSPEDEITVLHVVPENPLKDVWEPHSATVKRLRHEIAPKIIESTVSRLKNIRAKVATAVTEGHPDRAILDAAAQFGSELLVMGARGIKGVKSLFLGSVTRSVAINSPKPLLITKCQPERSTGALKALFATDGSDYALAAGRLLTSIPFPDATEVTILHVSVSSYMDIPDRLYVEIDDRIKNIVAGMKEAEFKHAEALLEKARELLSGRFPNISTAQMSGDPSEEILRAAQAEQADIIVVGSSGMRGVKGMLGSVARNILGHAGCAVLIGKTAMKK